MSDLKFACPHCGQHLEAPEELLGQDIDCPTCKGRIQLPRPSPDMSSAPQQVSPLPPVPAPSEDEPALPVPTHDVEAPPVPGVPQPNAQDTPVDIPIETEPLAHAHGDMPSRRISRTGFWRMIIPLPVVGFVLLLLDFRLQTGNWGIAPSGPALLFYWTLIGFCIFIIACVKRAHDRNKSGWWALLYIVPWIGWIWALIELGCLQGTKGPNRFGPDPLNAVAANSPPPQQTTGSPETSKTSNEGRRPFLPGNPAVPPFLRIWAAIIMGLHGFLMICAGFSLLMNSYGRNGNAAILVAAGVMFILGKGLAAGARIAVLGLCVFGGGDIVVGILCILVSSEVLLGRILIGHAIVLILPALIAAFLCRGVFTNGGRESVAESRPQDDGLKPAP